LLNLLYATNVSEVVTQARRLKELGGGKSGLILSGRLSATEQAALGEFERVQTVLLTCEAEGILSETVRLVRGKSERMGLIVISLDEAQLAARLGFDFVVAKGHEAGGWVGEETTFILLQQILQWGQLPVFAWGGIGFNTAAACRAAGACGVLLDWQLSLLVESALPAPMRQRIAAMDGSETVMISGPQRRGLRIYAQPGFTAREKLQALSDDPEIGLDQWNEVVGSALLPAKVEDRAWLIGQDGCFAAPFAALVPTVGRLLTLLGERVDNQLRQACALDILSPGGPLALSHHTEFPILQGPMTRVSDTPEFCLAVAAGGALPFLALAMLRGKQVEELLIETRRQLGDRSWGVGILGFIDQELRAEQMAAVEKICPKFAIIAGGRPDHAASMEAKGIASYLHVPSPGILETFIGEGARRFIFEGRECGGHVGPRTSFILWETMIRVILAANLPPAEAAKMHVVFAGGIHDAMSSAMVSVMAQPLAEKGMKVGVLIGTAYLFTEEAVSAGAIIPTFQNVASQAQHTVVIESGPGHAIRCADTEFINFYESEKRRLKAEKKSHAEVRAYLESLSVGRLRIASKGITRLAAPAAGENPYVEATEGEQLRDGMYMLGQVAALHSEKSTIRQLHERVCRGTLSSLREEMASEVKVIGSGEDSAPPTLDIAIIGMSGFFPGANDIETLWSNILAGRDSVTTIPSDRFDYSLWYDPDKNARDRIYSQCGGFIDDVLFDPFKYGIPPAALRSIEPAQLLTLEMVYQLLKDAGYAENNPYRAKTSVILGAGGGMGELGTNYAVRAMLPQYIMDIDETLLKQLPEWTEDSFPGILLNVIAGRVTNRFDFGGVNYTVDAACGSSLAAIFLACRDLTDGTSDLAIAGGCDTMQSPFSFMAFAKTGALSPRGRSRPFDASADGIAISEGVGAIALKRVKDAERDGDKIYAVIRGVGGGSDGRHKSLTAPSPLGQERTLVRAYQQARVSPATVDLFEMHGTGTALGDVTECPTLAALLQRQGSRRYSAAVGSIKSMIGHTKSTAGVAGVMKAALALRHRVLPPTIHVEKPNPKGGFDNGPIYINTETRPWIRRATPRRAGISAFGFGGTNFHAVLEEYVDSARVEKPGAHRNWPSELMVIRAASPEALAQKARSIEMELGAAMDAGAECALCDVAYTLHQKASGMGPCSVALVTTSLAELRRQLTETAQALLSGGEGTLPAAVSYQAQAPAGQVADGIAFLFPGQGSQYTNMLRDLALEFSEVSDAFSRADQALEGYYDRPLSSFIFPPPSFSAEERSRAEEELKATEVTQPALGVCGLAMVELLKSFGVRPAKTAGHSYGELPALYAAGAYDETALYALSVRRGLSMIHMSVDNPGADLGQMLAISESAQGVSEAIEGLEEVWMANLNSPKQTIISGTREGIRQAGERFKSRNLRFVPLPVACGFHSPIMLPARELFTTALNETTFETLRVPAYSNVSSREYPKNSGEGRLLLAEQLTSRVDFIQMLESMYAAGARVFVEAGAGNVLSKLVGQILGLRPHLAVSTDARGTHGITQFLGTLAKLIASGLDVPLDRLYQTRSVKIVDLQALARQPKPAFPAHAWWINGAYVRPVSEPPRRLEPKSKLNQVVTVSDSGSPQAATRTEIPAMAAAFPDGEPRSPELEVFAQYQNTMRQFLLSQQAILESFLGKSQVGVGPDQQTPLLKPVMPPVAVGKYSQPDVPSQKPEEQPKPSAGASAPAPVPAPVSSASSTSPPVDLTGVLLNIISERTGYPVEMLNLQADMEADLGIDSIKKVEIVAALRRTVLPSMAEPPAWLMEQMTGAKTMQQIIDGLSRLLSSGKSEVPDVGNPASQTGLPASEAAPTKSVDEIKVELLNVVSERTGYPAEMLNVQADMEADLGIDSIKKVEIVAALRRTLLPSLAEPPAWFMEQMTGAKTMQQIIDGLKQVMDEAGKGHSASSSQKVATSAGTSSSSLDEENNSSPRCVGVSVATPLPDEAPWSLPEGIYLLTDDGEGLAERLTSQITALGGTPHLISLSDLSSRESTEKRVKHFRDQGPIRGILHLLPSRPAPVFPEIDSSTWNRFVDEEIKSLLFLLQAAAPEAKASNGERLHVLSVSLGGGDFLISRDNECAQPWRGSLAGLLKTAAVEWPNAFFRTVDLDAVPNDEACRQLLRELTHEDAVDVGYRHDLRYTIKAVHDEFPEETPTTPAVALTESSVVLVTGGARGITAEVAEQIARMTHARFVLLGRSSLPGEESPATREIMDPREIRRVLAAQAGRGGVSPKTIESELKKILSHREIRQNLAKLQASAGSVDYISCDVRDSDAFTRTLAEIESRHGPIEAVIHGAGVLEDKYLIDKTAESFDRVYQTKIHPLLVMAKRLQPQNLKMFVLFGSVSGFFGNPGQGDYAAANEAMNRIARRLRHLWRAKIVALNWGPWSGVGMVTPEVEAQFKSRRLRMVSVAAGRRAMANEIYYIKGTNVRVVIGDGPWVDDASQSLEFASIEERP
jgi:acyl transferase domain-containing protein/NAD(P)H-dependent flavin oxidoreductase YrpB (nitropropane dioxygenase family)/acyl carrier protein